MLKINCGKLRDCVGIVDSLEDKFQDNTCNMLRIVIYNQLREKLDVNVHLTDDADLSVAEAIDLLLDYEQTGVKWGFVNDVGFIIM